MNMQGPQTRVVSFVEVCLGTALGFLTSFILWPPVAALHGLPYSVADNFSITAIFTVTSLVRQYAVRRFFAAGMQRLAYWLAVRLS